MAGKSTKAKPKISPYTEFKNWLFSVNENMEFPEHILKAINKRAVLSSMAGLGSVTIYLNKYFNTFDIFKLDDIEFYHFIREIVHRFRVKRSDMTFIKGESRSKNMKEIHVKFPYLKLQELSAFLEYVKDDEQYVEFCESIGIAKSPRKKKQTKKDKKMISDTIQDVKSNEIRSDEVIVHDLTSIESLFTNVFGRNVKCTDGVYHQDI